MSVEKDLSEREWKEIGNRIKMRRKARKLKQTELAERIGISYTHMCSIENGRQHPSVYVLLKISEVLEATPDYFLLGYVRRHNVPQNVVESLYMCDDSELSLICSLIKAVQENYQTERKN